ncbi:ribosomal RNA processing protein 36 homolog [Chenopodium quinoa]|uniref:ribosomal RNA processing protein 36 homolog n=1 Tax=Chenopodium quinoa TaxID=63459 RepID=UPI000B791F82|nr:ribosomal RNA processing protein 36 homolog [Chenopodium quinoa]
MKAELFPASNKIKFEENEENEDSSSEEDEEAEIENELADVPFGELQKARSDGTLALHRKRETENKAKRANKNMPMEVSSKKPVSRFREVIQVPKKVVRDPRFESLCGNLDEEGFKKRYNFIYEEKLPAEKQELKKSLESSKDPEKITELKTRIALIDKQMKSDSTKLRRNQILSEHKKKAREAVKQGKRPYFAKKSEIRDLIHMEKFKDLKEKGKLDSYMEKKRRRNAAKDHRFMPYRKSNNNE